MATERTMRADARKNYEALIDVARKHLSHRGVTTSLEAIAKEAGVGVGTLYRHFPDRDHLVFAALNAQGEQLREAAERLRSSPQADDPLEAWLREVENYLGSYQGLPASVAQALAGEDYTPLAITCHEIIEVTDGFLADARRVGTVRDGVTGRDLFESALMVAWLDTQVPERASGLDGVRGLLRRGYRS